MLTLALSLLVAGPATFETYVLTLDYDQPVRLVINGLRVDEPVGRKIPIEHYIVPGANKVFVAPLDESRKTPATTGQVRLEGDEHVMVCLRKATRETFTIGDARVLLRLMKIDGALRPYAVIAP